MNLRERLLRARVNPQDINPPERSPHTEPPTANPSLAELVNGRWVEQAGSRCLVVEHVYPLDHELGNLALGTLLAVPVGTWASFIAGGAQRRFDPQRAALVDIETTGLAQGAGTYAFLVGVGSFHEGAFCTRQYFMPDYGDEPALLDLLAGQLADHEGLITFNGRAFDSPILQTRFVLDQRPYPCAGWPHLDLLPLARRLWRRTLDSCALSSLEANVLGVRRRGIDVPGYLIPQLYQDYVDRGTTRPMVGVFYHNEMDLLAMVALAAQMGQMINSPADWRGCPWCDHLSLGMLYEHTGRAAEAVSSYQTAAECAHDELESSLAYKRLSFLLKREGRVDEAMAVWRTQIDGPDIYPYLELAKQFEHQLRDYAAAQHIVLQAIDWVRAHHARLGPWESRRLMAELEHRLERVEKRLAALCDAKEPLLGDSS